MSAELPACLLEGFTIFDRGLRLLWARGVLIILCLAPLGAGADSPLLEFTLKPRLCLLAENETQCHTRVSLQWRARTAVSVCLYNRENNQQLHCWPETKAGSHHFSWVTSSNSYFELRTRDNHSLLATQALMVQQQEKRYRQQRRNPWNFF